MAQKDMDVRRLLYDSRRLAATNLYAERYGGRLEEIRASIEELEADDGITGYYPTACRWENIEDATFRETVERVLRAGKLIAAIRLCREKYPWPLKYARQAVLAWQHLLNLEGAPKTNLLDESTETFNIHWNYTRPSQMLLLFKKIVNNLFRLYATSSIEFHFDLEIAGRSIADRSSNGTIYWYDLAASKIRDGEYMIFTCSCGNPGCVAFPRVEVIHVEGRTVWYDRGRWHIFETASYQAAISRAEEALAGLAQNYPDTLINVGVVQ